MITAGLAFVVALFAVLVLGSLLGIAAGATVVWIAEKAEDWWEEWLYRTKRGPYREVR